MGARVLTIAAALAALTAAPALAEEPGGESQQAPEQGAAPDQGQAPKPRPAGGRIVLRVQSGLRDRGRDYVARRQRVTVVGTVSRHVPGQYVNVEISRSGRVADRARLLIRKAGSRGRFTVRFRANRNGRYVVRATHAATDEQRRMTDVAAVRAVTLTPRQGRGGLGARLLQAGLRRLAYRTSSSGRYDAATSRAVLAFRKVNRMARTSKATRGIMAMLLRGDGGYRLRYPKHGKHIEADLSRQVLVLARDGKPERIYHTSTGTSATPTVRGSYRFYRKDPGTNSKGMVHSSYFIGGYAIHGYKSVPTRPASHGCLRVPIPNAREIFDWIRIGDRIDVYA